MKMTSKKSYNSGKDNPSYGKTPWNKGKKMPHSKEWEERRIAAVRESSKNKIYPTGYKRPREYTQPMLDAYRKKYEENPQKYNEISIRNLSKNRTLDLSGDNSPWWKGGITADWQKWKSSHGKQFDEWRKKIYKRDGYKCKMCGSDEKLEAHHIIPVSECRDTAFLTMNGVLLCKACHKKTDSYGGKAAGKKKLNILGNMLCIGITVPQSFQEYRTAGNYAWTDSGILVIFVTECGVEAYENAIFIHEFFEANVCKSKGISNDDITAFDNEFEKDPKHILDEPGDEPDAPYRDEHNLATAVERMFIGACSLSWKEYDEAVDKLIESYE